MFHSIEKLDKKGLRKFGFVTGTIVAVLFGLLLPWIWKHELPHWPWIAGGMLWLWAAIAPTTLNPVYQIWMRIGLVLGWINSRVILGLIFYIAVTPMSVIMSLIKRDVMARKFDPNCQTYRVKSQQTDKERMEKPY